MRRGWSSKISSIFIFYLNLKKKSKIVKETKIIRFILITEMFEEGKRGNFNSHHQGEKGIQKSLKIVQMISGRPQSKQLIDRLITISAIIR